MANVPATSIAVGDMRIQFGCTPKESAEVRVDFQEKFDHPPTVVLSPFWTDSGGGVGHVETLDTVSDDHFVLISNNAASSYFVSWLAVGSRDDVELPEPPQILADDLLMHFGQINRQRASPWAVAFETAYPRTPSLLVAPHWDRAHRGVGHSETVVDLQPTQAVIHSSNAATNYFAHWIAAGSASGSSREGVFFIGRDWMVQLGRTRKVAAILDVGFRRPFSAPPVVLVSPYRRGDGVGHAETLQSADRSSFSVISGNAARDYEVSWIALGRV